jgi:hypothetical protein
MKTSIIAGAIMSCPMFFVYSPALAADVHICKVQLEMIQEIVNARNKGISEDALIDAADNTRDNQKLHTTIIASIRYVYRIDKEKLPLAGRMFYEICLAQP